MEITLILIIAFLGCVLAFHAGRFNAAKEGTLTVSTVLKTLTDLTGTLIENSSNQMSTMLGVVSQKDIIIDSLHKENGNLRVALEEASAFEDMMEEAEADEDEEAEDAVGVVANVLESQPIFNGKRSAAHVALHLHKQVADAATILDKYKGKMSAEAYTALKANLTLPGKDDASS